MPGQDTDIKFQRVTQSSLILQTMQQVNEL